MKMEERKHQDTASGLYFWVRKMIRDQEERQQRVSVEGGTTLKGQWL